MLIVLFLALNRNRWSSVAKLRNEFAIRCELHDRIARLSAGEVDVPGAVGEDRMFGLRPSGNEARFAPRSEQISIRIEFEHGGRSDAALSRRWIQGQIIVRIVEIARPV